MSKPKVIVARRWPEQVETRLPDVFGAEPQATPALLEMEDAVPLPHLGSATLETRVAMGMTVLKNAQACFAGEEPPNRVA